AHRLAAGVAQICDAVEHGAMRWNVADGNHRLHTVKSVESLREFLLRAFAGRVERRRGGIAQTDHLKARDFHLAAMEVIQPETLAEIRGLLRRFVIAGDDIHPVAAL